MNNLKLKIARIGLAITSFCVAAGLLALFWLPYVFLKALGDSLAPDHGFDSFSPSAYQALHLPSVFLGCAFFVLGMSLLVFPKWSSSIITRLHQFLRAFAADCKKLFRDLFRSFLNKESWLLAAILLIGLVPRLLLLDRAIEYDEAYTFTQFARYPFRSIISDYSAPNNHVFHTILVRITYLLLGDHAWQIRLPAFLAGVLILIAAYLLGRQLYNKTVGLMAVGILAFLPDFILRSISARGYTLVVLMFLLCFILAGYLLRNKNLPGWLLLGLCGAIGFYSVPVMLYPLSVVYLWAIFSTKDRDPAQYSRWNWIKHVVIAAGLTAGLTVLFYSPILLSSRAATFYQQNNTLHSLGFGDFFQILPSRTASLLNEWQRYLPVAWSIILATGLVLSMALIKKNSKYRVSAQLAFVLALVAVVLIQRPDSVTRIWLWIVPLLAIWSSAGFVAWLSLLRSRTARNILTTAIPGIIVVGLAVNAIHFAYMAKVNHWEEDPAAEAVTLAILPHLTPDSYVVVNGCYDARYLFYFYEHGAPLSVFYSRTDERPFDRVFAIVYEQPQVGCGTEPVTETLQLFGPDLNSLDMDTLRPVETVEYVTVYEVFPRQ